MTSDGSGQWPAKPASSSRASPHGTHTAWRSSVAQGWSTFATTAEVPMHTHLRQAGTPATCIPTHTECFAKTDTIMMPVVHVQLQSHITCGAQCSDESDIADYCHHAA
eukprot:jgi/Ulvmu1/12837/UM098_0019.1